MKSIENKWMRAAVPALLIHCSIGTVYCWSSFSAALASEIGTSTSRIGFAFSLAIFFLGMSAAFTGPFIEKNIHKASLIACFCFTTGMVGTGLCIHFTSFLGTSKTIIGIYLFYGCIMGVGLGIGYLTPVKTLMLWFNENKGLGTGISIMGFGLAKAIASPLMNFLQDVIGLAPMFFVLSSIYFVMMMAGHFLLKKPVGWVEHHDKLPMKRIFLFKNRTFLGVWLMFYINITCGLALISYEKPIMLLAGCSIVTVSIIQSLTAASNALGRILLSTISDHMKDRNTIYKLIFISSLAITTLSFIFKASALSVVSVLIILMLIINCGYGGGFSTLPALLSSRFGMKHISTIHGVALSAWAFAGLSGNQITAAMLNIFGNYESVFFTLSILFTIALLISLFLINKEEEDIE